MEIYSDHSKCASPDQCTVGPIPVGSSSGENKHFLYMCVDYDTDAMTHDGNKHGGEADRVANIRGEDTKRDLPEDTKIVSIYI